MESADKNKLKIIIPIIVAVVIFMEFLDTTIINTAVPSIAKDFAISPVLLKYAVASYYVSLAVFIPISGWCADRFGTKKTLLISLGIFTLASLGCGLSHNIILLTIMRFIQGIGGALMNPVARIVILKLFDRSELVKVQSVIFTPAMLGFVLGPFLGGVICSYLSWHWIFFINVPVGVIILGFVAKYIIQYVEEKRQEFDIPGFIMVGISLVLFTFAVQMLGHYDFVDRWVVYASGIVSIFLFIMLLFHCAFKKTAVFDFSLMRIKSFKLSIFMNGIFFAVNTAVAFLLPLMYQASFNYTPAVSGLLTLPIACGFITARSSARRFIERYGFKKMLLINMILCMIWLYAIANISIHSDIIYIIVVEFLFGVSVVMVGSSLGALTYMDLKSNEMSKGTAIDITMRQFSASMGVGISAFILNTLISNFGLSLYNVDAKIYHISFYVFIVLIAVNLSLASRLKGNAGAVKCEAKA